VKVFVDKAEPLATLKEGSVNVNVKRTFLVQGIIDLLELFLNNIVSASAVTLEEDIFS